MTTRANSNDVELASELFAELAEAMHAIGFPADSIEDAIARIAGGHGLEVDAVVLHSAVAIEVRSDASQHVQLRRISSQTAWRFAQVRQILDLVDELSRRSKGLADGSVELARIRARPSPLPSIAYAAGYAVYSGVVAMRVGGAWIEMAVAATMALAIFVLAPGKRLGADLLRPLAASMVATCGALVAAWSVPDFNIASAIFGAIALLVPAMMMTTAAHELAHDRIEAGALRLTSAILRFVMLAVGIFVVLRVGGLLRAVPRPEVVEPLPVPAIVVALVVGGCGLAVHARAQVRDLPWIVAAVLLAVGAQKLGSEALHGHVTAFIAAFAVASFGYLQARIPGHVPAIVIVPGLLQLVPGLMGTRGTLAALAGAPGDGGLAQASLVALQLIIGLALAAALFGRSRRQRETRAAS